MSKDDIEKKVFTGFILNPDQAIETGFIDGFKTFDEMMSQNYSSEKVYDILRPLSLLQPLKFQQLSAEWKHLIRSSLWILIIFYFIVKIECGNISNKPNKHKNSYSMPFKNKSKQNIANKKREKAINFWEILRLKLMKMHILLVRIVLLWRSIFRLILRGRVLICQLISWEVWSSFWGVLRKWVGKN